MAVGAVANTGSTGYSRLIDPNRKWYNNRRLIVLNFWICLLLITSSTNGYDGSMMNGLQSLTQWSDYFHKPRGGKLGLLNAIQNIGSLAAYPFAPYFSDGIGRRYTILMGAVIMIIATTIQTASQSVGMFIGARFLIGFGVTFAANSAPMLVTEISYPSYRAPLTSTYNSLWYLGSIIAAWTTFGSFKINNTWAWRIPSALQALPSVFQVALIWFVPESPRWLVSKGREEQALKVLAYYHANGNAEDPLVKHEFEEIKAAIELDRTVTANVGWKSLISKPGNRRRMRIIIAIAFFSQWSGNGLASYYLNRILDDINITDPTIQLLINGILQIWNLAWALLASGFVDRLGRRLLFMMSAVGMFLFFSAQTICFAVHSEMGTKSAANALIAFIFLFYAAYDLAFTPLIVAYTVEILPYPIRAKGFNVFNFTISVALIFNQYVNPIALDNIGWKYYIVYVCWIAFECVFLYFYVVETKGLTLEETAVIFDGDDAKEQLAHAAGIKEDDEKGSNSSVHAAELSEKI
ncbi:hexose transporter [Guyanagaster necrorhizus]|uniref:Hexose transporter n=1 Tax=Guyanagaster necrorhizus TaxID=856835 RepID=A0A9P8ANQ7_9AGAR|nr:hexose transporter [Guyanagaster necrorhizus MCA 3950]KAG7441097.1 hexose transporter [Guyanagaster necrorhizus MCA 3950]